MNNHLLQWLIPAAVALAIAAAHFGYNEVRVGMMQTELANLRADVRQINDSQATMETQVIERLARIEERQYAMIRRLDDLGAR